MLISFMDGTGAAKQHTLQSALTRLAGFARREETGSLKRAHRRGIAGLDQGDDARDRSRAEYFPGRSHQHRRAILSTAERRAKTEGNDGLVFINDKADLSHGLAVQFGDKKPRSRRGQLR